MLFKATIIIN